MKIHNVRLMSVVFVGLIVGFSCSEEREITSEKLKQRGDELYYAINEEKPYSGKVVETYKSGQRRAEQSYRNGKLHGLTIVWDDDGQKIYEFSYRDGQQTGPYRIWYDSGQQEMEGNSQNGKKHGQHIFWHTNGQKQRECTYNDEILEGRWVSWYDSGQKQREGEYKNGKREGVWSFWAKDGQKVETDTVTDIDGNTYQTIKIGDQWWMAENLRVAHYRNGDAIPEVKEEEAWSRKSGVRCSYANDTKNAEIYGQLYNWFAVNDSRGLAPKGWHAPTDAEWQTLVDYLGGKSVAGGKMKESGTRDWNSSNESGFSGLPGGYRHNGGYDLDIGSVAYYWSSSNRSRYGAGGWILHSGSEVSHDQETKQDGFSVRCVKD